MVSKHNFRKFKRIIKIVKDSIAYNRVLISFLLFLWIKFMPFIQQAWVKNNFTNIVETACKLKLFNIRFGELEGFA